MTVNPAILVDQVSVDLGRERILQNISCTFARSAVTAIIGPNGAGKTTLLKAILGLIPFSGSIRFFSSAGNEGRPRLGYVPQRLGFDRALPITVLEFLALSGQRRPIWLGIKPSVVEKSEKTLALLHATHLLSKPLGSLSGGEMQRVLLAQALQEDPEILLLDEPVSAVDLVGGHLFCDVLEEVGRERALTVVMVSHDLSVVSQHAQFVICLNRVVTCQGEAPEVLSPEQLFAIYGMHAGLHKHEHPQPHPQLATQARLQPQLQPPGTAHAPGCSHHKEPTTGTPDPVKPP